jgi:hypothetical protein
VYLCTCVLVFVGGSPGNYRQGGPLLQEDCLPILPGELGGGQVRAAVCLPWFFKLKAPLSAQLGWRFFWLATPVVHWRPVAPPPHLRRALQHEYPPRLRGLGKLSWMTPDHAYLLDAHGIRSIAALATKSAAVG